MRRLRLPKRVPCKLGHESAMTRPQSASSQCNSQPPGTRLLAGVEVAAIKCCIRSVLTQAEEAIAIATSLHR